MKLEDIRQRGIDSKLGDHRDHLSRDLLPALVCAAIGGRGRERGQEQHG